MEVLSNLRFPRIRGTLKISRTGRGSRFVWINIDPDRPENRVVRRQDYATLIVEKGRFPITLLALAEDVSRRLAQAGIQNLAQLPTEIRELETLGLTAPEATQLLKRLGEFNLMFEPEANELKRLKPDRLQLALLGQPIENLELSRRARLMLVSVGIETIQDLVTKSTLDLESLFLELETGQKTQKIRGPKEEARGRDVVVEVRSRLAHFGLQLQADPGRPRGLAIDRLVPDFRPATPEEDKMAAIVLEDQFPFFKQYREGTSEEKLEARNALVLLNQGLAKKIASRNYSRIERDRLWALDWDDLFQEGCLGLVRSIESFDYTLGFRFSSYAYHWISQIVGRLLDDMGGVTEVPVNIRQTMRKFTGTRARLERELGRRPTREEIGSALGLSVEKVWQMEATLLAQQYVELDRHAIEGKHGQPTEDRIIDFLASQEPSPYEMIAHQDAEEAVASFLAESYLSGADREVVSLYFGLGGEEPQTLEEVGQYLGVTRERIRQRIERALETLQTQEVWEKLKSRFPTLPQPAKIPRFKAEVGEQAGEVTRSRKTPEEIAQAILEKLAREHRLKPEQLVGELSNERLRLVRRQAIGELAKRGKLPPSFIANLLGLRDEAVVQEELAYLKVTEAVTRIEEPSDLEPAPGPQASDPRQVLSEVASAYGLSVEDLTGPSRKQEIVWARHEAMYRLRNELKLSFPAIGRLFNRDPTSVIRGYYQIKRLKEGKKGGEP